LTLDLKFFGPWTFYFWTYSKENKIIIIIKGKIKYTKNKTKG